MSPMLVGCADGLAQKLLEHPSTAHMEFRPIDRHGLILDGIPLLIPKRKEEIMLDTSLSDIEKRQLMRVIKQWDVKLLDGCSERVRNIVMYGICEGEEGEQLESKLRTYVEGVLRWGGERVPLVYPYGGSSSIIQGLCRAAAIKGTIQMLNQPSVHHQDGQLTGLFEGEPWSVMTRSCREMSYDCPPVAYCRCVMILTTGLFGDAGCNYWIVPPQDGFPFPLFMLQVDGGSGCCPNGLLIVYCWSQCRDLDIFKGAVDRHTSTGEIVWSASYYWRYPQ